MLPDLLQGLALLVGGTLAVAFFWAGIGLLTRRPDIMDLWRNRGG